MKSNYINHFNTNINQWLYDNDKIIIILLVVIVAMLAAGIAFLNPFSKQTCNMEIVSMDSLYVGGQFTVYLSDSQGKPIANEEIAITFTGSNGEIVNKKATTDASGNAVVQLESLPAGTYTVSCSLLENSKYGGNSTSKQITINDVTEKSTQSSGLSEDGYSYYPEYGPAVDSQGVTREEAIANNMHYISMRIDGEDVGGYVPYDPKAGCYHT